MRNAFGYILGFLVFVAGIPALRFTRNPMLVGVYIYDIGVLIWLQSWWPIAAGCIPAPMSTFVLTKVTPHTATTARARRWYFILIQRLRQP